MECSICQTFCPSRRAMWGDFVGQAIPSGVTSTYALNKEQQLAPERNALALSVTPKRSDYRWFATLHVYAALLLALPAIPRSLATADRKKNLWAISMSWGENLRLPHREGGCTSACMAQITPKSRFSSTGCEQWCAGGRALVLGGSLTVHEEHRPHGFCDFEYCSSLLFCLFGTRAQGQQQGHEEIACW